MDWILDHLSTLLIVGVVTFLLIGLQHEGQRTSTNAVIRASGRGLLNQTVDWIERDLANLGAGTAPGAAAIAAFDWESSGPGTFVFCTTVDTTDAAPMDSVRYELVEAEDDRFELRRYSLTSSGAVLVASSGPTVRSLSLVLLDAASLPTTDFGSVRAVDVQLSMDPLLGHVEVPFVWIRRFHPLNLVRPVTG